MTDDVALVISHDEAVVLLGWLHRFNSETGHRFDDQAEQRALWNLEAVLESIVEEPFSANYTDALAAARARLRDPEAPEAPRAPPEVG